MRPFHYFKPVVCSVKVSVALTLRATKYEIQAGFRLVFLLTFSMEASGTLFGKFWNQIRKNYSSNRKNRK
jgi:putative Mn2+ efflux pump MntP